MKKLWLLLWLVPAVGYAQGPEAIDQVYRTFSEAYRLLDPNMIRDLYEPDAYYFYPNSTIQKGHDSFMPGFTGMFDRARESQTTLQIDFRIVERQVLGDHAYDVGYYKLSRSTGDTSVGKFVTILRQQPDGRWKFVLDTYSSAPVEAFDQP